MYFKTHLFNTYFSMYLSIAVYYRIYVKIYSGHNCGTTVNVMFIIFMLHDVKLFDDFGKFLMRHAAIYYRLSTRVNQ